MRVGSVGVGSGVDGAARGGQVLSAPALRQQAQDRGDDDQDEDEASNGNADGELALVEADRRGIVGARGLKQIGKLAKHVGNFYERNLRSRQQCRPWQSHRRGRWPR